MKTKEEFNFNKELEKWYSKWMRKPVSGRCLIELKNRDKEFIKLLKEVVKAGEYTQSEFLEEIDKLVGTGSNPSGCSEFK